MVNGIFLIITLALLVPILTILFKNISTPGIIITNPYFWIALVLIIPLSIITGVINGIIYNLVMPEMYLKKIKALQSFKNMFRLFLKQFKEVIIYWVFKFLLGFAAGILSIIVFLLMIVLFGIAGLIIFGIGFLLSMIVPILVVPLIIDNSLKLSR